ncbi:Uncharacterised protein [Mycobacteroides abscessus subsp. abscessus]|nr:Uncharacterised protein [Mycobacteroides abscessus subsp. abscessus]
MVLWVFDRVWLAYQLAERKVLLAASGNSVDHHIADRLMGLGERSLGDYLLGFSRLDLCGEFRGGRQECRALLGRRLAHLLACRLLLGAQRIGRGYGRPPGRVGVKQHLDECRILAPQPL